MVDDDESLLKLCTQFLEFKGFNIIDSAKDGIEAIKKYKNFEYKPDIIIMDYKMPFKNGIETAKEILRIDKQVKILLMSADNKIEESALAAGAIKFKSKPFDLHDLYNSLLHLIQCNIIIS
ncbi:MAG: response regulator [Promethearchaeota archaeon]